MRGTKATSRKRSAKTNGEHETPDTKGSAESLVDRVAAAWGAIVVERIAADQTFAEVYDRYANTPLDIRRVFAWDALVAAEQHLTMVNAIIGRHLEPDGRGDAFAILDDLKDERRRMAAHLAV